MSFRSALYDDIYFSNDDALAESKYVYVDANDLPHRFSKMKEVSTKDQQPFVIAELGFGVGLNFLVTSQCFLKEAPQHAILHYYSIEKHILPLAVVDDALTDVFENAAKKTQDGEAANGYTFDDLAGYTKLKHQLLQLLRDSSWQLPGFHTLFLNDRIRLTVMTGEAELMLSKLGGGFVDAWFADGFAPAKNPAMWTEAVFQNVGRLSKTGTTVSTFSSAGDVRRRIKAAGFVVEKRPGLQFKREMVVARFEDTKAATDEDVPTALLPPKEAVIIGGGIAGLMTSLCLLRRGWSVELVEKEDTTGSQGSGNPAALFMPHLAAEPTIISRFSLRACETLLSGFRALGLGEVIHNTGMLRRISAGQPDLELQEKIERSVKAHQIPSSMMRKVKDRAHYMIRKTGWIEPVALCTLLTRQLLTSFQNRFRLTLNQNITTLPADRIVVVANGTSLSNYSETQFIPLKTIRGQLFLCDAVRTTSYLNQANQLQQKQNQKQIPIKKLKRPILFENYVIPMNEQWVFGSTFDHGVTSRERVSKIDHQLLLRIAEQFPEIGQPMLADGFEPQNGRVGFRSQSKDYIPVVGGVADHKKSMELLKRDLNTKLPLKCGVFVIGGFGSRGISSSMLCAEILAARMNHELLPIEKDLADALLPERFIRRDARRK